MSRKATTTVIVILSAVTIGMALLIVQERDEQKILEDHAGDVTTTLSQAAPGSGQAVERTPAADAEKENSAQGGNPVEETDQSNAVENPPEDVSGLEKVNSFVTAQRASDGESIQLLFFLEGPGYFTIQEKTPDGWTTIRENAYYAGTGSLPAGKMTGGESSKTIRALKIVDGRYVAVSDEFTITRADVLAAGGIKTYAPPQ
jgi:hypothetical protein